MKKIVLVCIATLLTGIVMAEKLTVTLSDTNTSNPLITQTMGSAGGEKPLGEVWNQGGQNGLMLNKNFSGLGGENTAFITFSSPAYTMFNSYAFDVWKDGEYNGWLIKLIPKYGVNKDEASEKPNSSSATNPDKVSNAAYNARSLKFITFRVGGKVDKLDFDYRIFSNNWKFGITIPEVVQPEQQTTTALERITESQLNSGTTQQRTCTLTFTVLDPIGTTATTIKDYFEASFASQSGDKWELGNWSVKANPTPGGRHWDVSIPVIYTATNKTSGNFEAIVQLKPKHSVEYNGKNYAAAKTQKVTIAVNQKTNYPIDWWQAWREDELVTLYKGDVYERNEYLINTTGYTLSIPVMSEASPSNVLTIDNTMGKITASNEGTATLTYIQPGNDEYNEKVLTVKIQVKKRIPEFTLHAEETYVQDAKTYHVFYPNKEYPIFVETDNNDYSNDSLTITPAGDMSDIISFDGVSAVTKSQLQDGIQITVHQEEGEFWDENTQEFYISIRNNPLHVGALCERNLCELFGDKLESYEAKCDGDRIILGTNTKNTNGGHVVFQFVGAPDKLEWTYETTAGGSNAKWTAMQSITGEDWTTLGDGNTFNVNARFVKLAVSGTYTESLTEYGVVGAITSLCVTEKVGFELDPTSLSLVKLSTSVAPSKFVATISNLTEVTMCITGENAEEFSLSGTTSTYDSATGLSVGFADGLGIDRTVTIPVTVNYMGDFNDPNLLQKKCTVEVSGGRETKQVLVDITQIELNDDGLPAIIVESTADATGIYTGTDQPNFSGDFTAKIVKTKPVYLSNTFDKNGNALFDELYIFGKTVLASGASAFVKASTTATNNAITPCYVYVKGTDGQSYRFSQTIANVNQSLKPLPNTTERCWNITSGSKKLYFTGFCPFGSTGCTKDDEGLIYIKGAAGTNVDVYLEDCQLYCRQHSEFGNNPGALANYPLFDVSPFSDNYPAQGSGSAIVFECTSENNASSPFRATIHTSGDNILYSQLGCAGTFLEKYVGQYSSSVYVRAASTKSYTVLSFDDKWPTDVSNVSEHIRTNGFLKFGKSSTNSPSIDIGNANSVVNFNGGRIELQNSAPAAQYYVNKMAICYRAGSADIGVAINIGMGMGGDEVGGTVNFNDGTVNAGSAGAVLFCPKNTYIKGGSHNNDISVLSSLSTTGGSPTDGVSTLIKLDVLVDQTLIDEKGLAKEGFLPKYITCEGCGSNGENIQIDLMQYYVDNADLYNGGSYGIKSVAPDKANYVHLWVPGKGKISYKETPWVLCMPHLEVGASEGSVGTVGQELGGNQAVPSEMDDIVYNLLYTHMDDAMQSVANDKSYKVPVRLTNTFEKASISSYDQKLYGNITNNDVYTVQHSIYYLRTILADSWIPFCAPFDVSEVYVVETYNETELASMSRNDALAAQAVHNMDFAALVGGSIKISDKEESFNQHFADFTAYVNSVKGSDKTYQNTGGKYQLTHYDGTNLSSANYYLYGSERQMWTLNEDDPENIYFETDWQPVKTKKKIIGDTERNVIMEAGKVYAMQFPYCPNCNEDNEWDYWTGKVIIFVGYGPQDIDGKNAHEKVISSYANDLLVDDQYPGLLRGNATFSEVQLPTEMFSSAYVDQGGRYFAIEDDSELGLITAGGVYLLLPPDGYTVGARQARIKSINSSTGAITWEEDNSNDSTTTGTPTISGNRQMMVYNVAGGVGVIPVTAQQVSIYNAAGQLITSQYITEEMQISLPAGIYLISGEKEQAKAIVR